MNHKLVNDTHMRRVIDSTHSAAHTHTETHTSFATTARKHLPGRKNTVCCDVDQQNVKKKKKKAGMEDVCSNQCFHLCHSVG